MIFDYNLQNTFKGHLEIVRHFFLLNYSNLFHTNCLISSFNVTRSIAFVWHFYIPEHYRGLVRCSLMRALRDVDLHRPAMRRRRRVELANPSVHIKSAAHQCRTPTTHRTNTCLQSHQRNHHYRDCLYNIRHNTEYKYINLGCLRAWHTVNITRTPWDVVSSLPIMSRHHLQKKKNQCLLPESDTTDSLILPNIDPNTPEQTREKTPIIRRLMKLRLRMTTRSSSTTRRSRTRRTVTYISWTGWSEHIDTSSSLAFYWHSKQISGPPLCPIPRLT